MVASGSSGAASGVATEAYIALGSNLGDSVGVLTAVLERLRVWTDQPLRCSSFWRSEPVDCPPDARWFVNAVAALVPRAGETPEGLLERLLALEREFGRRPKRLVNESRPLDLDLIAFGTEVRRTVRLTLPHPRAHQRGFVLAPLNELAPGLVLPGQKRSVSELLAGWVCEDGLRRMGDG
jgi:2-amino-4-hydroxy-6-hydroxymethyldihydropteridine diphosphokinase